MLYLHMNEFVKQSNDQYIRQLKELRQRISIFSIKQRDISEVLGIDQPTISRILRDNIRPNVVQWYALVKAVDYLIKEIIKLRELNVKRIQTKLFEK